ncbi:MAG: Ig-like domain-containing protein [Bacteroidota bacterium]
MQNRIIINTLCCLATVLFSHCAQIGPLTGGDKDVTPPKLKEAIPAIKSTNFHEQEIILKFDEYVKLNDAPNQITILPQLKLRPEFEVQGKIIKIKLLQQVLDPGVTYRIDFGKAIADMHEGNILENFAYVFSTGPFIDTLRIRGNVSNAFDNKAFGGATVLLFQNTQWFDSLVYKTKANYMVKTNNAGDFEFNNLPTSRYLVYAIEDKNKNNVYDGESEQVALLGPPMDLKMDTTCDLKIFKEESIKSYVKKINMNTYGFGQIILNKAVKLSIKTLLPSQQESLRCINTERLSDTASFFYKGTIDTLALLVQNINGSKLDTLKLVVPKKPNNKTARLNVSINEDQGKLPYRQNLVLSFQNWMDTSVYNLKALIVSSKTDSSLNGHEIKAHWRNEHQLELMMALKEGHLYKLKIDKGAFSNLDAISNDSLIFQFKTYSKTDFGKFNLKLSVTRQQNYLLHLLNDREEVVKEVVLPYTAFKAGLAMISFSELLPAVYSVKIIFDNNENKKWDRGDALISRLPEPVIISRKRIKIVADWETEEQIILGEK